MTLPVIARVGVVAGWHASPAATSEPVAHLMPTSWAADGRKTRPALCGQRRIRWINATAVERDLSPCDSCLGAAEALPAVGQLVQIAPKARLNVADLPGRVSDPMQPNSVRDRLGRRLAFRNMVELSDRAAAYVEQELDHLRRRAAVAPVDPGPEAARRLVAVPVVDSHDPHRPLAYSSTSH